MREVDDARSAWPQLDPDLLDRYIRGESQRRGRQAVHRSAVDEQVAVDTEGLRRRSAARVENPPSPQPWSMIRTPGGGWSSTVAVRVPTSPTLEDTRTRSPSVMLRSFSASSGWMMMASPCWRDAVRAACSSQEFIECRWRRFGQLEREVRAVAPRSVRRGVHGHARRTRRGRRAPSCPAVRKACRKWPNSLRPEHPAVRVGEHVTPAAACGRPTLRPVARTSRSTQCGVNSRPGIRVDRGGGAGCPDEPVESPDAEQRSAHGDREIGEDAPLLHALGVAGRRPAHPVVQARASRAGCW